MYCFHESGVWYEGLIVHLAFLSSLWNAWMIECRIGGIGAKRIGEMLEQNTSLKTIDLSCENPFNIHSSSIHFDAMCSVADVHSWERHGWSKVWYSWHGVVVCLCVGLQPMKRLETMEPGTFYMDWRGTHHLRNWRLGRFGVRFSTLLSTYCGVSRACWRVSNRPVNWCMPLCCACMWSAWIMNYFRHIMWSYRSSSLWYHNGSHWSFTEEKSGYDLWIIACQIGRRQEI